MKKAYLVQGYWQDSETIVFAETPSKAKVIAINNNDFYEEEDYIDLRATREKEFDEYADIAKDNYLDFDNPEHQKILKEHGWHEID